MLRRARRCLPAFAAGLLLLAPLAGAPAARAASAPATMFNLGDWSWPTTATLDREAPKGLRTWRVTMDFAVIGRTAGTYDWGGYDGLVRNLATRGMKPLFVLKGCPTRLCGTGNLATSGAALTEWQAFVAAAARRYGTGGTFWAANPSVPLQPVRYWQVMNEVNGAAEWPSPSAAAYAAFLVATAKVLKATDASALVVSAGLPELMTVRLKDYLTSLYAQPGFRAATDVIAVHGYAADPAGTARVLDTARAIMLTNGDGGTGLWVTEFAWATTGLIGDPFVVSEATQAGNLRATGDMMIACAARWNLQRAYWYGWRDKTAPAEGYWGYHVGLNRYDGTAKPALSALDEFTSSAVLPNGRAASCTLPGGTRFDLTVPDTTITSGPSVRTPDPRPAYTFAASESPVRYECSMDGAAWAGCTPDATTGIWRPATALGDGTHTLRVRAIDPFGNVDQSPATSTTVYDRYPPDTYITGPWGNVTTRTVSLSFTANEPVARYECQIDTGVWAPCTSPISATFANGAHWIRVRAVDLAGWTDVQPAEAWYQVNAP